MLSLKANIKVKCGVLKYRYDLARDWHSISYEKGCAGHMWTQGERKPAAIINHLARFCDESEEVRELCAWLASQAKWPGK